LTEASSHSAAARRAISSANSKCELKSAKSASPLCGIALGSFARGPHQCRQFGAKHLTQAKQPWLAANFLGADQRISQRCGLNHNRADRLPFTEDQQKAADFRLSRRLPCNSSALRAILDDRRPVCGIGGRLATDCPVLHEARSASASPLRAPSIVGPGRKADRRGMVAELQ
jgi:hypothetical protein